MKKRVFNLKSLAVISALLVLFFSVAVAHAGLRWSGIDPVLSVNKDTVSFLIEWPEHSTCLLDEQIDVDIWYPEGADVALVSESHGEFQCETAENGVLQLSTDTDLKAGTKSDPNRGGLLVSTKVNSSERLPIKIEVYVNGELARKCRGFSGEYVDCGPFKLDKGRFAKGHTN